MNIFKLLWRKGLYIPFFKIRIQWDFSSRRFKSEPEKEMSEFEKYIISKIISK